MLCRHCARTLLPRPTPSLLRTLTSPPTTTATTATTATTTKPSPSHPRSSTLAGTTLQGLAYLKPPAPTPVARDDAEYSPWLWDLLSRPDEKGKEGESESGGDAFAKSKKQRRIAAKAARARVGGGEGGGEVVAVQRGSVDLAVDEPGNGGGGDGGEGGGGGMKGMQEREGLKRAMRRERRGKVREGNFLRGMR